VDYHSTETLTPADGWTPVYRSGAPVTAGTTVPLNDNLGGVLGRDRAAAWQMTANYKIGWTGGGDWVNYSRTLQTGTYEVWAALSHGGTDAIAGRLDRVTSDPSQPNQTTTTLGVFAAPPTGGWGSNVLVPMQGPSTNGVTEVVSLGGQQTLRFYPISGDFDYFLLIPATAGPRITGVSVAGGNVTVTWTGGGTLFSSPVVGPGSAWTTTGDSDGSFTEAATGTKYYRVQQ
jgi:hypothetical protein